MWWLFGCTWIDDDALKERLALESDTAVPGVPDIVVDPEALDLGLVLVGDTATGEVVVENAGDGDLSAAIRVTGAGWSTEDTRITITLAPGAQTALVLSFRADAAGAYAGTLTLTSDDPDEPAVVVPLSAEAEVDDDLDDDGWPTAEDCDEGDASVNPGATETWYDGVDQDCSDGSDYDQDLDGHEVSGHGDDCDDLDADVYKDAPELGYTGVDEDCDGLVDEMAAATSPWTLRGAATGEQVGSGGVFALPDLDGDGDDDLVVCTPQADVGGSTDRGAVSFHDAATAGVDVAHDAGWLTLSGNSSDDDFGSALAVLGDYDGDGFVELAIGASQNDAYGTDDGTVYVIGAAGLTGDVYGPLEASSALWGNASNGNLGSAVAGGDFDGDGIVELASGAPGEGSGRGDVYVSFRANGLGNSDFPADASSFSITGVSTGDHLGEGLAFGDLDADGYDDLVACSPDDDDAGGLSGSCWVFAGASTRDGVGSSGVVVSSACDAVITGAAGDRLGATSRSVAVGDLDDDGADDLALGAPGGDGAGGATWIFANGTVTGALTSADAAWVVTGDGALGTAVAVADVTGDGMADLLGGAPTAGGAGEGAVYLLAAPAPGTYTLPADQDASWTGEAADDAFGTALGAGADLDGDGVSDLVVAAVGNDAGADAAGKAYVFSGY